MRPTSRSSPLLLTILAGFSALFLVICLSWAGGPAKSAAQPAGGPPKAPSGFWKVDDIKPGMKGDGRTVMKGTKVETFQAEVLGVLKNTSPGRDMVLCRLSGLDLEKTGVIAGMSGSPVYIDGKLVGAVAYAWAFGKEPDRRHHAVLPDARLRRGVRAPRPRRRAASRCASA